MFVTEDWIRDNYIKYRTLAFNDKIPPAEEVKFVVNNSKNTWGLASVHFDLKTGGIHDYVLKISNAYYSDEYIKLSTLLHEMIHIYDYYNYPHHYIRETTYYSPSGIVRGYKAVKNYNPHDYTFFRPMAEKVSKITGIDIFAKVQPSEIEKSELSQSWQDRMKKAKEKGYILGWYTRYGDVEGALDNPNTMGLLFKTTSQKSMQKIIAYHVMNFCRDKGMTIEYGITHDPKWETMSGCVGTLKGRYVTLSDWMMIKKKLSDYNVINDLETPILYDDLNTQVALNESFLDTVVPVDGGDFVIEFEDVTKGDIYVV